MSSRSSLPAGSGLWSVESGEVTGSPDSFHDLHLDSLTAPGPPHSPFAPGTWAPALGGGPIRTAPPGGEGGVHAEEIAGWAESGDLPDRGGSDDRVAAELLAGVDVREMDLDDRQPDGGHRVAERNRVV